MIFKYIESNLTQISSMFVYKVPTKSVRSVNIEIRDLRPHDDDVISIESLPEFGLLSLGILIVLLQMCLY